LLRVEKSGRRNAVSLGPTEGIMRLLKRDIYYGWAIVLALAWTETI
jgi:hypothetical protein